MQNKIELLENKMVVRVMVSAKIDIYCSNQVNDDFGLCKNTILYINISFNN